MLPDALAVLVREAGGEALLLDARHARGLITDAARVEGLCKNLRNAGFARLIDFTAEHIGAAGDDGRQGRLPHQHSRPPQQQEAQEFWMLLTLRHPGYGHCALTLKWKWVEQAGLQAPVLQAAVPADLKGAQAQRLAPPEEGRISAAPAGDQPVAPAKPELQPDWRPVDEAAGDAVAPRQGGAGLPDGVGAAPMGRPGVARGRDPYPATGEPPAPPDGGQDTDKMSVLPDSTDDTMSRGAGQPGGQPLQAGPVVHPTLSLIWPAAGLAEREIFEMFGIPFAGNENLAPLLLDEQFQGFPLRRDYELPPRESYAARLLRERHEQGMLDSLVGRAAGLPTSATGGPPAPPDNEPQAQRLAPPEDTGGPA